MNAAVRLELDGAFLIKHWKWSIRGNIQAMAKIRDSKKVKNVLQKAIFEKNFARVYYKVWI